MGASDALRFGVVSSTPGAEDALDAVSAALGERLGRTVVPRFVASFGELASQLAARHIDVAWAPPIAAVQLELVGRAAILAGVWRGDGSVYSSALYVLASSKIQTLDDLRGKRIAWVDRTSAAGYVFPKLELEARGHPPDRIFSEQRFEGTHEAVARAVFDGTVDVGATHVAADPATRERGTSEPPGWTRVEGAAPVRTIMITGTIPPDAIVASTHVAEPERERLTEALLAIASDERTSAHVRALFAGRGFVLVGSYQYAALRAMLRPV